MNFHIQAVNFQTFEMDRYYVSNKNQSVENAGVAFVKGANERNYFFEIKKKTNSNV